MNVNATSTLLRCAIHICATKVPVNEKLDSYACNYLKSKGFAVNSQQVSDLIDKFHMGSKLYGTYRENLAQVQKKGLIQEVYRTLWLYTLIANSYESLTSSGLLSIINSKFEEEKKYAAQLERNKYSCFKLIDRDFCANEMLKASGKILTHLSKDLSFALNQLYESFAKIDGLEYMSKIYGNEVPMIKAKESQIIENADKIETTVNIANVSQIKPSSVQTEDMGSVCGSSEALVKNKNITSELELQLRDEINMLKKDKRDLEIRLSYAKKDAIREVITTLTDYGWNCPLNELYRLLKDEETPETIKGIINNLFMAFGSENIKVTRGKIGEKIILTEENQKSYDPYKNEELFLGDKAELYYPGYRYDHEIMVRPIVRKVRDKEN